MEDGYSRAMDQGWFRVRSVALTAAALTILAVAAQFGQDAAFANIPQPDPTVALTLFAGDEKLLATGWWAAQGVLATVALGFGIAATLRSRGRVLGVVAIAGSLAVLVL